ncbi:hypothetical protein GF327_04765 [Candidatus Woesearchaeota archaeon]|nr:hypothetical protein [Candidatus Woesearchaeota archaeon]
MKFSQVKKKYRKYLMVKQNVLGFGYGTKVKKGKKTGKAVVSVLVSKKKPLSLLSSKDIIPKSLNGMPTDVLEVGKIKIQDFVPLTNDEHTAKYRPAIGGISIGHKDITAGTFGCVVYKNNIPYILSNNHVLANSNDADKGDAIYQPGPYDGGTYFDRIAVLEDYVEIDFGGESIVCKIAMFVLWLLNWLTQFVNKKYRWSLTKSSSKVNYVDAAIAKPLSSELIEDKILKIGKIKGTVKPVLGMQVQKSGRTTGYTTGTIDVIDASVTVNYGEGKEAVFEEQIITGPISQGGDSGSAVFDMNNNLVGLLFAGSDQVTILNPIARVFELLDLSLKPCCEE